MAKRNVCAVPVSLAPHPESLAVWTWMSVPIHPVERVHSAVTNKVDTLVNVLPGSWQPLQTRTLRIRLVARPLPHPNVMKTNHVLLASSVCKAVTAKTFALVSTVLFVTQEPAVVEMWMNVWKTRTSLVVASMQFAKTFPVATNVTVPLAIMVTPSPFVRNATAKNASVNHLIVLLTERACLETVLLLNLVHLERIAFKSPKELATVLAQPALQRITMALVQMLMSVPDQGGLVLWAQNVSTNQVAMNVFVHQAIKEMLTLVPVLRPWSVVLEIQTVVPMKSVSNLENVFVRHPFSLTRKMETSVKTLVNATFAESMQNVPLQTHHDVFVSRATKEIPTLDARTLTSARTSRAQKAPSVLITKEDINVSVPKELLEIPVDLKVVRERLPHQNADWTKIVQIL